MLFCQGRRPVCIVAQSWEIAWQEHTWALKLFSLTSVEMCKESPGEEVGEEARI